jgi:hypothetical protein
MTSTVPELLIAPALVAVSTLAARRWGAGVGGLVSAFPAVVGPVLLIVAQQRGAAFAAGTATGTLLGLVALSAFAVAYSRLSAHARWQTSLMMGWGCSALVATVLAVCGRGLPLPAGLAAAAVSLAIAHRAIPRAAPDELRGTRPPVPGRDIPLRVSATVALIVVLTTAVDALGSLIGGILTALPVLASVLAAFTHRDHGPHAVATLLRGMMVGMAGFAGFCALVAVMVVPAGVPMAFGIATCGAVAIQAAALGYSAAPAAAAVRRFARVDAAAIISGGPRISIDSSSSAIQARKWRDQAPRVATMQPSSPSGSTEM